MIKHKRALFFWSLVALFLIIAPTVVLRAKGYRFDFSRGVFVYSGLISIESNPAEINVYLDGKLKDSDINNINNNLNIKGLIPKKYDLTVKAPGFQEWNKKVDVHSGFATEFWNVLLVKNNYETKEYATPNIQRIFISPKNKLLAYNENLEKGINVKILNIKDNSLQNTFTLPDGVFEYQLKKENIEWSPEEDYLSVPLKIYPPEAINNKKNISADEYNYFILDPKNNTSFNLNEFLGKDAIKNVRWDPKDKNYLFFLSEKSLYRANITDAKDLIMIAEDISSFDLSRSGVYYSQMPTELVFKANLDGQGERKQITTDFPQSLTLPNEKLIVYDESRIVFLNQNEDLFLYNKNNEEKVFKKIAEHIKSIQFSDDGKKLLYWSDNEISTYFLSDWTAQPARVANENSSITRFSEKITNVQWFKDYEHVIFSVGNQYKIIELDPRDKRNIMNLVETKSTDSVAVYNNALQLFFFTNPKENINHLYSIIFPERTTFLGF